MKLNRESFHLAAASFAAGFLLCWVLFSPAPPLQHPQPAVASLPIVASTAEMPPKTFHAVLKPAINQKPPAQRESFDDALPIEIMKQRRLHLIDTRYQPPTALDVPAN